MYVSRLSFYTRPSHTEDVAQRLRRLSDMIATKGLSRPRVLRVSMASAGAPDLQFEEEFGSLAELEQGLHRVVEDGDFHQWSREMSDLLLQSPKREVLMVE